MTVALFPVSVQNPYSLKALNNSQLLTASLSMMSSSMRTRSVNEGLRLYGSCQQSFMIWTLKGLDIQCIH